MKSRYGVVYDDMRPWVEERDRRRYGAVFANSQEEAENKTVRVYGRIGYGMLVSVRYERPCEIGEAYEQ